MRQILETQGILIVNPLVQQLAARVGEIAVVSSLDLHKLLLRTT